MKNNIIVFIIIVCILGLATFLNFSIHATSHDMSQSLNIIEKSLDNQDWTESNSGLQDFSKKWSKTKSLWSLYLYHEEIDNIDLSFARLSGYIKTKSTANSVAELAALKLLIDHIPEISKVQIENIF
jgi:predicted negative regulator of RcsB-dependent stress response